MADSENLYQQIKNYFLNKDRPQIVIEISGISMDLWKVIPVNDIDEMIRERGLRMVQQKDFAGFIHHENEYYFYFVDRNFYKSEAVDTGRIDEFQDRNFLGVDLNKVVTELRQFLQGS